MPIAVGAELSVPASVFSVKQPGHKFTGRVVSINKQRRTVDIKFGGDKNRYWFPVEKVEQWIAKAGEPVQQQSSRRGRSVKPTDAFGSKGELEGAASSFRSTPLPSRPMPLPVPKLLVGRSAKSMVLLSCVVCDDPNERRKQMVCAGCGRMWHCSGNARATGRTSPRPSST